MFRARNGSPGVNGATIMLHYMQLCAAELAHAYWKHVRRGRAVDRNFSYNYLIITRAQENIQKKHTRIKEQVASASEREVCY